ncbi:hypothetical protein HK104_007222, partial [Borealophlyctis nickersoniae]
YGGSITFQNYVQLPEQNGIDRMTKDRKPGALDKGQSVATALSNYFTFWSYFTPLIGAVIADQYLGKYKTIVGFAIFYMIGWIVLTASSVPSSYMADETPVFGSYAFPCYVAAITIIGFGTGGIKSVVSPMCADQIPAKPYVVEKKGQKFLVDQELTVQHMYNWWYWAINLGSVFGMSVCTTLERSAFWKGFLVPAVMFFFAIVVFVIGRNRYVHVPPEGSVFLTAIKCMRYASARKKANPGRVAESTSTTFKFLDYAEPLAGEAPEEANKRTWGKEFPQELRQTLKACSVFPLMTIYWVTYNQMTNNLISQAGQMTRPQWMGNDLLNILDPIFLVILIPVFDYYFYPFLARRKIHFGYVARITVGFMFGALAMVVAAVIQKEIYVNATDMDHLDDGP